jgi:hypothetical protein
MHTTIADMLVTQLGALANQLAHVLPWVKSLNEDERADLLADLAQACVQVRHTGQSHALLEVLEDWEATAHAVGDKQLTDRLLSSTTVQDYTSWEAVRANIAGETAS